MDELSLVTGGAGFIGSHLVDDLVRRGRPVRVLDDFSTGRRENLAHHAGRVEVIDGSLADPAAVARATRGVGVVYHLGALASVARSVENPAATHAACATGTLHLLDAARSRHFPHQTSQSATITPAPRRHSAARRLEPMNPAPPVTRYKGGTPDAERRGYRPRADGL